MFRVETRFILQGTGKSGTTQIARLACRSGSNLPAERQEHAKFERCLRGYHRGRVGSGAIDSLATSSASGASGFDCLHRSGSMALRHSFRVRSAGLHAAFAPQLTTAEAGGAPQAPQEAGVSSSVLVTGANG